MKWVNRAILSAVVMMAGGCGRMDQHKVYRIARDYVQQQAGDDAVVSPESETLFAIGKNAARVDVGYRGSEKTPVEGRMTVWCKRIRMRWEFDRAIDNRSATPSGSQ